MIHNGNNVIKYTDKSLGKKIKEKSPLQSDKT